MTTIKHRRGTTTQWNDSNPTLADGEIGFERTTGKIKIGNGSDDWDNLEYLVGEGGGGGGETHTHDGEVLILGASYVLTAETDIYTHVQILDDDTDSALWPNRFEFEWKPNALTTVGQHLTSWFNEYGEFRVTPAKDNTVPFRVFSKELSTDAEHSDTVPVMEMVWSRNDRAELWGVMYDGSMYSAGSIEIRVPSGPTLQTGHIFLEEGDPVPTGTPDGTLIIRYDAG